MLGSLDNRFRILALQPPGNDDQLSQIRSRYQSMPEEYFQLVQEATEVELEHQNGQYLRLWSPLGCIEMDDGYEVSKRIPNAIPIGDDGGGKVLLYMNGRQGFGLYHVGYGDLDTDDAVFLAPSLKDLLHKATGMNTS